MKHFFLILVVMFLTSGCGESPPEPIAKVGPVKRDYGRLREQWQKVEGLDLQKTTIDNLVKLLGPPDKKREQPGHDVYSWFVFDAFTKDNIPETHPMLSTESDIERNIVTFVRYKPFFFENVPPRVSRFDSGERRGQQWRIITDEPTRFR